MWDGVRNYAARNHLKNMKAGDPVFFYHSNEGLAIVGIVTVVRECYPDPTTDSDAWVAVDIAPLRPFDHPVTLAELKNTSSLSGLSLIKQSRLSVCPVTQEEYSLIVQMGKGKL